MSKIFVTSDQHFFHDNIIKYCKRPFINYVDMNKEILKRYNEIVSKDAICIHLGDLSANVTGHLDEFSEILRAMNGRKILTRGNHDYQTNKFYIDSGFEVVGDYIAIGDYFFNHYGFENNEYTTTEELRMRDIFLDSGCKIVVHGHNHMREVHINEENGYFKRINAAIDLNDYKPILIDIKI